MVIKEYKGKKLCNGLKFYDHFTANTGKDYLDYLKLVSDTGKGSIIRKYYYATYVSLRQTAEDLSDKTFDDIISELDASDLNNPDFVNLLAELTTGKKGNELLEQAMRVQNK